MVTSYHYINVLKVEQFAANDNEFIKEMLKSFIKNTSGYITNIKSAFENSEWEELAQAIHKVKPTYQYLYIEKVKTHLEKAEKYAKFEPKSPYLPIELASVYSITDHSLEEANDYLSKIGG